MTDVVFLPLLIPLLTAAVLIAFRRSPVLQQVLSVLGSCLTLAAAIATLVIERHHGTLVLHVGNWPAPFGICLVADPLSAILTVVAALIGLTAVLYSFADIDHSQFSGGFHPLVHILVGGVCGAFLTGDLFNLFVWFEVMLMASFVLLAVGARPDHLGGSVKYLVLNFISSGLFLAALGLLYGKIGTLNMADVAQKLAASENSEIVLITATLLMVSFAIKAGLFPLFSWLPASYHTTPIAISALFAGLLTKVGIYAMMRVYALLFADRADVIGPVLVVVACLTMIVGVLGAASQFEIRRILAWHIISQIGYMALGLALFTPAALAATIFYIVHHIIVKTNLFFLSGVIEEQTGSDKLKSIGGIYRAFPVVAVLFLIPALSLGGVPPLSGFFAKLDLVRSAVDLAAWLPIAIALFVGVLTLFSMTKIWAEAFWKDAQPEAPPLRRASPVRLVPITLLALITILIGLQPERLLAFSKEAADRLMDRDAYISAVLPKAR